MASQETKGFLSSLLIIILFVIGCLFLYWAVEYWTERNGDRGRYELIKIQTGNGVDTWSFWKLDRRAGRVEYCSLNLVDRNGVKEQELTCIPAKRPEDQEAEEARMKPNIPLDQTNGTAPAETETVVTTTTATPEVTATPATPAAPAP